MYLAGSDAVSAVLPKSTSAGRTKFLDTRNKFDLSLHIPEQQKEAGIAKIRF